MDVQWRYNNIQIKEGDEWKATFIIPYGLYEPLVMFFRQCNSPPVMVGEAPLSFPPFTLVDCSLFSHFSFDDFITIAFLDLAEDLETQI